MLNTRQESCINNPIDESKDAKSPPNPQEPLVAEDPTLGCEESVANQQPQSRETKGVGVNAILNQAYQNQLLNGH